MLTVDKYGRIRRAHRDGMNIREIARQFHHSRYKIREVLQGAGEPPKYRRRETQHFPKLALVLDRILEILQGDETAPPKQRHTAMRLFERLRDEHGYTGGYDTVRRFVKQHRGKQQETFIPLDHAHGQRMEADFGKIYVDFPEGRKQVSVLILVWSCSNAPFAMALPTERTESILEGMKQGFEFFGCIPREVWWDNPKTVAEELLIGRDRRMNPRYAAFASHYAFEPLFCMPASGNEKPVVENRVKTMQRRWGTPVPTARDMDELNVSLRQNCVKDQLRPATAAGINAANRKLNADEIAAGEIITSEMTAVGDSKVEVTKIKIMISEEAIADASVASNLTIGDVLKLDIRQSAALPRHPFEACVRSPVTVDKYQMVRFDKVGYSVPRQMAFKAVTVKGFINHVEVIHNEKLVATHVRNYEKGSEILDPLHYLITLTRRPGALDHANVYRDWQLPECFVELRSSLEQRHGVRSGVRHFVRVLQLLSDHSVPEVATVIEQLRGSGAADADRIIRRVESSSTRALNSHQADLHGLVRSDVTNVKVPSPGLTHFDSLLVSASVMKADLLQGSSHEQINIASLTIGFGQRHVAAEIESETASITNHRPRIREAGSRSIIVESDVRTVSAATDRTGGHGSSVERFAGPHQAGESASGEGSGQLRLLSDSVAEQAEDSGTGTRRMDHESFEHLPAGSAGNG